MLGGPLFLIKIIIFLEYLIYILRIRGGPKRDFLYFLTFWEFLMAADYPLVIKDYVSYLKITLRINFKIKIEYVKLLF